MLSKASPVVWPTSSRTTRSGGGEVVICVCVCVGDGVVMLGIVWCCGVVMCICVGDGEVVCWDGVILVYWDGVILVV